jgi:antitoxin (DNA-binding transcriptional repressor) of toxin-antitoxin stability system
MSDVTVTQVARHFADYVNRVAYRRESFTLVRGNKPLAELRPLPQGKLLSELPALFASLPRLSCEEADAFADDVAVAQDELTSSEVRDAWQS